MAFWLGKTEPYKYAWADLVRDGQARWDGVRNFQARNNLGAASVGDGFFIYHSREGLAVVGFARVSRSGYPDPTADEDPNPWLVVDIQPVIGLKQPVSLAALKADSLLRELPLVRQSRLSVSPVTEAQARRIFALGETPWPA